MELEIKNQYERECYEALRKEGWFVSKKGWPDFLCIRGDDIILVEVKPKRSHRLKKHQYLVMTALTKAGLKCYRWTPEGFEKVTEKTPHISF